MRVINIPLRHVGELFNDIRRAARGGWTGAERRRIALEFLDLGLDFLDDGVTPFAALMKQLRARLADMPAMHADLDDGASRRAFAEALLDIALTAGEDTLPESVSIPSPPVG